MRNVAMFLTGTALIAFSATLLVIPEYAVTHAQQSAPAASTTNEPVPAFHAQPPNSELPPTMDPSLYSEKLIFNAYTVAGRVKKVLYQEPCYCHCDQSHGHGSLLDCFVSRHGSGCETCIREAFYSYEQTRKGKTPVQIREGIIRGEYQQVDLAKYQNDLPPASSK
jgi:Protein of unknown function with PCYCGC motif